MRGSAGLQRPAGWSEHRTHWATAWRKELEAFGQAGVVEHWPEEMEKARHSLELRGPGKSWGGQLGLQQGERPPGPGFGGRRTPPEPSWGSGPSARSVSGKDAPWGVGHGAPARGGSEAG